MKLKTVDVFVEKLTNDDVDDDEEVTCLEHDRNK